MGKGRFSKGHFSMTIIICKSLLETSVTLIIVIEIELWTTVYPTLYNPNLHEHTTMTHTRVCSAECTSPLSMICITLQPRCNTQDSVWASHRHSLCSTKQYRWVLDFKFRSVDQRQRPSRQVAWNGRRRSGITMRSNVGLGHQTYQMPLTPCSVSSQVMHICHSENKTWDAV